ncbi:MAG TPA: hypothetical protein VMS55_27370 [Myxococcota bacterium]|nr:hypothetical protein [Myxococcota bacterium]
MRFITDCASRRIAMQAWLATAVLVVGEPAFANPQVGANVYTSGTSRPLVGNSTNLGSCESTLSRGNANEVTITACDGGSAGPFVHMNLIAEAEAPRVTGFLPELHASSRIHVDTTGPIPVDTHLYDGFGDALFLDYIQFGSVRPNYMIMDFVRTGTLDAHGDFSVPNLVSQASVDVQLYAQDVYYAPPFAGSFIPYGTGSGSASSTFENGSTTDQIQIFPGSSSDFQLSTNGTGLYELYLGPAFFSNPSNTHLLLQMSLSTHARVSDAWVTSGVSVVDAVSDFSNTLEMTSLQAFDAEDHDITADAIAGFASDALPLPEPGPFAMWTAGLSCLAVLAHRRRHVSLY